MAKLMKKINRIQTNRNTFSGYVRYPIRCIYIQSRESVIVTLEESSEVRFFEIPVDNAMHEYRDIIACMK